MLRSDRGCEIVVGLSASTQTELGNAVGVTFQQVQKYEKGTNRISASRIQQMAAVLQVPLTYFFDGDTKGRETFQDPMSKFLLSGQGAQLVEAFQRIPSNKIGRGIVDLVEELAP